jgi:plasmid maintenance system antidote protein VapI
MENMIDLQGLKKVIIGEIIRDEFLKTGMTVAAFARKLGCNRSTVYTLFKNKSVDVDLLVYLSHIFKRNLLDVYRPIKRE